MNQDNSRSLEEEMAWFCKVLKNLKRSVRETRQYFRDLNTSTGFTPDGSKMTDGECGELEALTRNPPAIIVVGRSSYAKAMVVNRLLKQMILPCTTGGESAAKWRSVRFRYHHVELPHCVLTDPNNVESMNFGMGSSIADTIPLSDLAVADSDDLRNEAELEVKMQSTLLMHCEVRMIRAWKNVEVAVDSFVKCIRGTVPIVVYAAVGRLHSSEIMFLKTAKTRLDSEPPILVVSVPLLPDLVMDQGCHLLLDSGRTFDSSHSSPVVEDLSLSLGSVGSGFTADESSGELPTAASEPASMFQQLIECGFLAVSSPQPDWYQVDNDFVESFESFLALVGTFAKQTLQCHLMHTASLLNVVQRRCLQMFISVAFDMSRYLQITPRRLDFVKEKEAELFATLTDLASNKQSELLRIIAETKDKVVPVLLDKVDDYVFLAVDVPASELVSSAKQVHLCVRELQDLVLGNLSSAIESQLVASVSVLRDSYTGVLQRCLEHLEEADCSGGLESGRTGSSSQALNEIIRATYQIEITIRRGTSWTTQLVNKMKQVVGSLLLKSTKKVDAEWRKKVILALVNSLDDQKLASSVCAQINERVKAAHEAFLAAVQRLDEQHASRQGHTELQQQRVRQFFTPKIARLTLESTSLKDYILYGVPAYTRQIGIGSYGSVYECQRWANWGPCAVKVVQPPDEKHLNDLAMEFCYTKNLPEHERIVTLRGSIIDTASGINRCELAVMLIMDRYPRDLHTAIKCGLDFVSRLRVSLDVIEGIRFLHGQGLVHRDIKLKNVLLDENDRGKITDLGFCKPEAMISGSVVGTPIHMAPELKTGKYDNSVDMYAFGVLFWYVCAGSVRPPNNYNECDKKDVLWNDVRKGLRPERLRKFDSDCWALMERCWHVEPKERPWPGEVEPTIQMIMTRYATARSSPPRVRDSPSPPPSDTDTLTSSD